MSSSVDRREIDPIAREIRALHELIQQSLRKSVQDAIRIGGLLEQKKAELEHGFFLTWIHEECGFADRTAQRYMRLHRWQEKLTAKNDSVSDLTEAYHRVELLEGKVKDKPKAAAAPAREERGAPKAETADPIFHRPREQEPVVEQDSDEQPYRGEARKATTFRGPPDAEWKEKMARFREEDAEIKARALTDAATQDRLREKLGEFLRHAAEAADRFGHLAIAGGPDNALQDTMLGVIQRYVLSFDPPARRVEVAHNLIKALRLMIHEINGEEESA